MQTQTSIRCWRKLTNDLSEINGEFQQFTCSFLYASRTIESAEQDIYWNCIPYHASALAEIRPFFFISGHIRPDFAGEYEAAFMQMFQEQ